MLFFMASVPVLPVIVGALLSCTLDAPQRCKHKHVYVQCMYPKNPPNILVKNVMMSLLAGEGEGPADSHRSIIW